MSSKQGRQGPQGEEQRPTMLRKCEKPTCKNGTLTGHELRKCARCRRVVYCSVECQKSHWSTHKVLCTMLLEHPDRANLPSVRQSDKDFEAAKKLFNGDEPVEKRIRWFTLGGRTAESRQAREYMKKLDTEHAAQYAIEKFISMKSRGCVVFDISKPVPIVGRRAAFLWLNGGVQTGSKELVEAIQTNNPTKSVSILLYAISSDKTYLHVCRLQVPFDGMYIPDELLEKATEVMDEIEYWTDEGSEDESGEEAS